MKEKLFTVGLALVALLTASTSHAAIIASYPFDSSSLASTDGEGNSSAGNITLGSGVGSSGVNAGVGNPAPSFGFNAGNIGTAQDSADYIEFIVTASPMFVLNLTSLTFDTQGLNGSWAVSSSVAGHGSNIATDTIGASFAGDSIDLSGAGFQNLSSITFRLYAWNGAGDNVDVFFDNIILNGTVVPEVGTVWAGLGVLGAAILGKRFLKKKRA
ncbi:MAG: hypothetical protein L0Y58_21895 [Verrucomicrobia subdivision 3 bacterium]|nr:hypothetical protein [Limisphaerales bacterium]